MSEARRPPRGAAAAGGVVVTCPVLRRLSDGVVESSRMRKSDSVVNENCITLRAATRRVQQAPIRTPARPPAGGRCAAALEAARHKAIDEMHATVALLMAATTIGHGGGARIKDARGTRLEQIRRRIQVRRQFAGTAKR